MNDYIHDFYCSPRAPTSADGPWRNIYEIWEKGEAFHDSITPSTYCPDYRAHMVLKVLSLAKAGDEVFSIGCGNAFVEAGLRERGLPVRAIDCNAEAVALACAKGVDAFTADFSSLPSGAFEHTGVIYADGLLGHLYRPESGLDGFFETLVSLRPRPSGWLVLSNDAPLDAAAPVMPHPTVRDFWFLSRRYLSDTLTRFGYQVWESYHFPYERPVSGLRNRTICVARVASPEPVVE